MTIFNKTAKWLLLGTTLTCMTMSVVQAESLRYGDRGKKVTTIQQQLIKNGYQAKDKAGVYGKETKWAVRLYQQDNGLTVDGIVGPETYKKLMSNGNVYAKQANDKRRASIAEASQQVRAHDAALKARGILPRNDVRAMLNEANNYLGVPYVFGGTTPSGFDCSGYVQYVFDKMGVSMPRLADEQYNMGYSVSRANLQPGDLVFFETYEPGPSHSGIYIGNGQFISATSSRGVAVADLDTGYWGARYIGAKRVMQ